MVHIKRTVTVRSTDKEGHMHVYNSLDEVPEELRNKISEIQGNALKEALGGSAKISLTFGSKPPIEKKITIYKIKDATGNEHVYHSLEELPPEMRAAFEKIKGELKP